MLLRSFFQWVHWKGKILVGFVLPLVNLHLTSVWLIKQIKHNIGVVPITSFILSFNIYWPTLKSGCGQHIRLYSNSLQLFIALIHKYIVTS